MLGDVVAGGGGLGSASSSVTITPPAGERWAITHIGHKASLVSNGQFEYGVGGNKGYHGDDSGSSSGVVQMVPRGAIFIDNSNPLTCSTNSSGLADWFYSGVKLS